MGRNLVLTISLSTLILIYLFHLSYEDLTKHRSLSSSSSSSSHSLSLSSLHPTLPGIEALSKSLSLTVESSLAYTPPSSLHPSFDREATFSPSLDARTVEEWGLRNYLHRGVLTIAITNYAHLNMARNLAISLEKVGHQNSCFYICLDDEIYAALRAHNLPAGKIPTSWLGESLKNLVEGGNFTQEGKWGGPGHYFAITHIKSAVMYQLLLQGFTVLFTDVDIVFPRPGAIEELIDNFERHPDLFFQVSLEAPKAAFLAPYVNSGFYITKPHPVMLRFFELVTANQLQRPNVVDQFIFNEALDLLGMKINGARRHNILFLDHLLFCNGYYYFMHQTPQKQGIVPFMVHANYVGGGKKGKEGHLYRNGLWYLDPPQEES